MSVTDAPDRGRARLRASRSADDGEALGLVDGAQRLRHEHAEHRLHGAERPAARIAAELGEPRPVRRRSSAPAGTPGARAPGAGAARQRSPARRGSRRRLRSDAVPGRAEPQRQDVGPASHGERRATPAAEPGAAGDGERLPGLAPVVGEGDGPAERVGGLADAAQDAAPGAPAARPAPAGRRARPASRSAAGRGRWPDRGASRSARWRAPRRRAVDDAGTTPPGPAT